MCPEGRALEFLMVAIAALVFVGPKDLPILLRKLGQFMARVRAMAAEFRASFDEMARQSELDELRKEVEAMRNAQFSDIAAHAGAPEVAQTFDELSQGLTDVGVDLNMGMNFPYGNTPAATVEMTPIAKPARAARTRKVAGSVASKAKAAPKTPSTKPPTSKAPAKSAAAKVEPAKRKAGPAAKAKPAAATAGQKKPPAKPATRKRARTAS